MFCQNCGHKLPDGSMFCSECGTKQEVKQAPIQPIMTQPVMQQPIQPVVQPTFEQPVQPVVQPAFEQPVQPIVQPVFEQPVQPIVQPVFEQPVQPIVQPVFEQPVQKEIKKPAPQSGPMRASTYPGPSDNSVNATIEQAAQPTVPPVMQQPVQPAVQPAMQPQVYGQPMNPAYGQPPFMQPVKKKKTGLIIGIIAALAVIATAIILIIVLGGNKKNNTYKAALKTFITGINEQNLNKMYSVLPEPGVRYAKNEIEKYWEGADYYFNEHLDVDEYTVSYKITSVESMNNQNDLYLIEGDLLMYGYQCDVTDSCIVHTLITFTSKTNPNDVEVDDDEEFHFIKINGKWYLYNYVDFI